MSEHPAPGLVVMLEQAGRTIGVLEARIDVLTEALDEERAARRRLAELLASARSTAAHADTPDVDPSRPSRPDTLPHETTAAPRPGA